MMHIGLSLLDFPPFKIVDPVLLSLQVKRQKLGKDLFPKKPQNLTGAVLIIYEEHGYFLLQVPLLQVNHAMRKIQYC